MSGKSLEFKAGPAALSQIREQGFSPEMIRVMAGASGGPKWLVLSQLDRVIPATLFANRNMPLFLIGSSIGGWRFSCYARRDPLGAIEQFEEAYVEQHYEHKPTAEEVTDKSREILGRVLGEQGAGEILAHPFMRLSIMAVRSRALTALDNRPALMAGLGLSALANLASRKSLGLFYVRALFYDPRDKPPFLEIPGLPMECAPLDHDNLVDTILATGSIPLVLKGVRDIPGAVRGTYRDGGIIDYHFDVELSGGDGLVFYPHFYGHITPGWFDKYHPRRRASPAALDRMLLIHPSDEFVAALPYGKIPDRQDFAELDEKERIAYWRTVVAESRRLADEFLDVVESGRLPERLSPLVA